MTWLLVLIIVLVVITVGYYLFRFFKKHNFKFPKREKVKKEKPNKIEIEKTEQPEIVKPKEDPDTQVDQNNLEIDGFFSSDGFYNQEEYNEDSISDEYNNLFNSLFENSRNKQNSIISDDYDNELGEIKESEIYKDIDYDNFYYEDEESEDYDEFLTNEKSKLNKTFENLPLEIKALLLTDGLKKKDDN